MVYDVTNSKYVFSCILTLKEWLLLYFFTENNFQEDACQEFIELLRDCCRKWSASSISCSGIDIKDPPKKVSESFNKSINKMSNKYKMN